MGVVQESNAGYSDTITLDDGRTIDVGDGRGLTGGRFAGGFLGEDMRKVRKYAAVVLCWQLVLSALGPTDVLAPRRLS